MNVTIKKIYGTNICISENFILKIEKKYLKIFRLLKMSRNTNSIRSLMKDGASSGAISSTSASQEAVFRSTVPSNSASSYNNNEDDFDRFEAPRSSSRRPVSPARQSLSQNGMPAKKSFQDMMAEKSNSAGSYDSMSQRSAAPVPFVASSAAATPRRSLSDMMSQQKSKSPAPFTPSNSANSGYVSPSSSSTPYNSAASGSMSSGSGRSFSDRLASAKSMSSNGSAVPTDYRSGRSMSDRLNSALSTSSNESGGFVAPVPMTPSQAKFSQMLEQAKSASDASRAASRAASPSSSRSTRSLDELSRDYETKTKTPTRRLQDMLSGNDAMKSPPREERLTNVMVKDAASVNAGDDALPIVTKTPMRGTGSAFEDYELELRTYGVVVISALNIDTMSDKMYLFCETPKGTKFYVEIVTFSNPSLYLPANHTTLTAFSGKKMDLVDAISVDDCKKLATCDVLYNCGDEYCFLQKTGNMVTRSEYVVASQELGSHSLHTKGTVVARPLVKLTELRGNSKEALSHIEMSAEQLFDNAKVNSLFESNMVLRKLAVTTFDTINVENLFRQIINSIDMARSERNNLLVMNPETADNSDASNKVVVDINLLNETKEQALSNLENFNSTISHINRLQEHLRKSVDGMKETVDRYNAVKSEGVMMAPGSPFVDQSMWDSIFTADKNVAPGASLEVNFRIA